MTSLTFALEKLLHPDKTDILKTCATVGTSQQIALYLVGGTVRDVMLGRVAINPDLDITGPEIDHKFALQIADALHGEVTAISEFGTYKLSVPSATDTGVKLDLVASRSETYREPAALPDVSPGTIEDDLARRDFSMGAMCMVMTPPRGSQMRWGDLVDPFCGQSDVQRKLVRILHPQSFVDDPTRIFRALRYTVRLGFDLEINTANLLKEALVYVHMLSGDRIRHELERIFDEKETNRILRRAYESGLLHAVFTEMGWEGSDFSSTHITAGPDERDTWIGLLAYSVAHGQIERFLTRLNLGSQADRVARDVAAIRYESDSLKLQNIRPSESYSALVKRSKTSVRACAEATESALLRSNLTNYLEELMDQGTALTGKDLLGMGVPEGPDVGSCLKELLYARLDGEIATVEEERALVRSWLKAYKA